MTLHLPTFAHLGPLSIAAHIASDTMFFQTGQQYEHIAQAQRCCLQIALLLHGTRTLRDAWLSLNTHFKYSTWVTVGLNTVDITTTTTTTTTTKTAMRSFNSLKEQLAITN